MTGRLAGRAALDTGGARGIGRATVERFAEEGARVLLTDWSERRGAETAEDLAKVLAQAKRASKKREGSNYVVWKPTEH